MGHRNVLLDAPVVPIEYPAEGEQIVACTDCLPWSAEVVSDHPDGGVWVREWHAIGCEVVEIWTENDRGGEAD